MNQPTHYIECYRWAKGGIIKQGQVMPIEILADMLQYTRSCNLVTVAVWKITPKNVNIK